jgi:hypothetical protein
MPENELLKALRNIQNPPKPKPAQKPGSTGVPAIDKQVAIRAERERKQLAKVEKTNTVTYRRQVGTSPIKAGAGYKPGEVRQRTAEAEMADYDRRVFGIVTSGDFSQLTPEVIKRLGGVKRAKQMFAERNNYRDTKAIPMIAEINRRNEAYTSGGLTQEELDQIVCYQRPDGVRNDAGRGGTLGGSWYSLGGVQGRYGPAGATGTRAYHAVLSGRPAWYRDGQRRAAFRTCSFNCSEPAGIGDTGGSDGRRSANERPWAMGRHRRTRQLRRGHDGGRFARHYRHGNEGRSSREIVIPCVGYGCSGLRGDDQGLGRYWSGGEVYG